MSLVRDFGGMRLPERIRIKLTFPIVRHKVGDCRRSRLQPCATTIELDPQSGDCLTSGRFVYELFDKSQNHSSVLALAVGTSFAPPEFPDIWSTLPLRSNHAPVLHGYPLPMWFAAGTIQAQIVFRQRQK